MVVARVWPHVKCAGGRGALDGGPVPGHRTNGGSIVKLLTEREQVRRVAEEWRWCWPNAALRLPSGVVVGEISQRLAALDPETATAADVEAAGANGYVEPHKCHECGEKSWDCVRLGGLPDYLDCTATICERCLRKALALIERERFAAEVKRMRSDFAEAVGRHMGAKAFSADIVRGIDWNKVVFDWFAERGGSAGAPVTGTDPALGRDWTAASDARVRGVTAEPDGEP